MLYEVEFGGFCCADDGTYVVYAREFDTRTDIRASATMYALRTQAGMRSTLRADESHARPAG